MDDENKEFLKLSCIPQCFSFLFLLDLYKSRIVAAGMRNIDHLYEEDKEDGLTCFLKQLLKRILILIVVLACILISIKISCQQMHYLLKT
jgi:hypothetical protein